jgi:two-component system, LytTR family, sensor kinase
MEPTHTGLRPIRWRWIAAIWLVGALFDACQTVLVSRAEGRHHPWLPLFATEFVAWLPWVLATPLIVRLARRYPIGRGTNLRTIGVHLAAFLIVSALAETWSAVLQMQFNPWENHTPPTFVSTWSVTLLFQVLTFLIAYSLILTITFLIDARDRISHQATEAARLNEELSRAQLAALRAQIEPHFIYNTLNSIAGLVRDQRSEAAVSMLVGLSEFLRRASEDSSRPQVTLREEVEYLQRYLDIQKVRFGERLQVSVQIPEQLLGARVPNLLLQPLVENAIKHGIGKRISGGWVRVAGVRREGELRLSIYNDAPPLPPEWGTGHTGVGIGNLRTRLEVLHGGQAELQLNRGDPSGVEVIVRLPFREA